MIELERTFLAKEIPKNLKNCRHEEIIDIYIPESAEHPVLRIRKNANNFEMTKKMPVKANDSSEQSEQTIVLSREEFDALSKIAAKRLAKDRYYFLFKGKTAEIDVYKEALSGLVLVDFEFGNQKEKSSFQMPDFCLADVTQEKAFAGGMLCGKNYADLEQKLAEYGYKKISFKKD